MPKPRDFDRRLDPLRLTGAFRSRGGSSSASSLLGLADDLDFFGRSSAFGMRSAGVRRSSASAAGKPNSGSLRPPPFFFPHAIRKTPSQPRPRHTLARAV